MPSRAVTRKKARREAKRAKGSDSSRSGSAAPAPFKHDDEHEQQTSVQTPRIVQHAPRVAVPTVRVVAKRHRVEEPVEEVQLEGLSRKERRRVESNARLQKQLTRYNTAAAASAVATPTTAEDGDEAVAVAPLAEAVKERHDPKFANGTFWRTRKERRARTLFLGGIPSSYNEAKIKDMIFSILDTDELAAEYLSEIETDKAAVEEVDFLPTKHQAKVRHMYVTLASVPLAGCAASRLDGLKVEGRRFAVTLQQTRANEVKRFVAEGNRAYINYE